MTSDIDINKLEQSVAGKLRIAKNSLDYIVVEGVYQKNAFALAGEFTDYLSQLTSSELSENKRRLISEAGKFMSSFLTSDNIGRKKAYELCELVGKTLSIRKATDFQEYMKFTSSALNDMTRQVRDLYSIVDVAFKDKAYFGKAYQASIELGWKFSQYIISAKALNILNEKDNKSSAEFLDSIIRILEKKDLEVRDMRDLCNVLEQTLCNYFAFMWYDFETLVQ